MNALFAYFPSYHILSVSSVTQSCLAHCDSMDCSMPGSLSITNSQSLLKLMSFESVMPSNHLILCHPLHLPPSIFPSIMVFSNESVLCIRWPKYRSFSISVGLVGSPCSPRDSQASSPTPQFKSINSLAFSFLYSPALTSKHDQWKNHSLD